MKSTKQRRKRELRDFARLASLFLTVFLPVCALAQYEPDEKCVKAIEHVKLYTAYKDAIFKDAWGIYIVPPDFDQKCLIAWSYAIHKKQPDVRLEFFDVEGKELEKYIAYNRDNPRGKYSMEWVDKHRVGTLQLEAELPCAIWVVKAHLEVIARFDRIKCLEP